MSGLEAGWLQRCARARLCVSAEEVFGRATLMRHLVEGQYERPARVVDFNIAEGWFQEVAVEIADELRRRFVEWSPEGFAFLIIAVEPCGSFANFAPRKPPIPGF